MTMYVRANGDQLVKYPFFDHELLAEYPRVSFPTPLNDITRAEYGMFPVVETEKPAGDIVESTDPVWNATLSQWEQGWSVTSCTLEEAKELKKQQITNLRFIQETSHPTIDTTRESQAMINGVWSAAQIDPTIIVNFKNPDGTWVQIDANTINALAQAVIAHVQACFDNEKALHEAVDAAADIAELEAIDTSVGWPTYP
jgi:hypothetical protein